MLADLEPNTDPNNAYGSRYFSCVIGEGIYYFAVLGSSGSGAFILDFFENTNYVDREINDTAAAQIIGCEAGQVERRAPVILHLSL